MAWIYLILGGLFEVGFTTCLAKAKWATGSELVGWLLGFVLSCSLSMFLLYQGSKQIPMGTAYIVWAGIGAVGAALVGIFFMNESISFWRIFFISTLLLSIIGLKLYS